MDDRGGVRCLLCIVLEVPLSSVGSDAVLVLEVPLSSEYGKYKTVKASFWPWFSGKSHQHHLSCSLFDRKRSEERVLVQV